MYQRNYPFATIFSVIFAVAAMFASVPARAAAQITSPSQGATDVGATTTIEWSVVPGALAYYLYVGTAEGKKDLVNTGEISQTRYTPSGLPDGLVYARIYTKLPGAWESTGIRFTVRARVTLTNPRAGATNVDTRTTFNWIAVKGARAYYLHVGTIPEGKDILDTGETSGLSATTQRPLPANTKLYARLHVAVGNSSTYSDSTFTTDAAAVITSPADGATDVDRGGLFEWTTVPGAQAYYLYVGSTLGSNDLINTGETQLKSHPMSTLPTAKTVYARIHTKYQDRWRHSQITLTTSPAARLTAPLAGAVPVRPDQTARWTAVEGAEKYYLTAGASLGSREFIDSGELTATSHALATLPGGVAIHLRLYTRYGGRWWYTDSTINTAAITKLSAPQNGAVSVSRRPTATWTEVHDAQVYRLHLGSTLGANDLVDTGEIHINSYKVQALPAGQKIFARLWTKRDDRWLSSDSTFTTAFTSLITSLPGNAITLNTENDLMWDEVAGVTSHYIYVGTIPDGKDLADSGEIKGHKYSLRDLPGNRTLYVRLYSLVGELWLYEAYTLLSAPIANLVAPKSGSDEVDLAGLHLTWAAVDNATGYRIDIGSSRGSSDYWHSPVVQSNDLLAPPLPGGMDIHVRVWTLHGGVWRSSDGEFGGRAISQLKYPLPNALQFDATRSFEWTSVEGATAYSLQLGTAPGTFNLLNTGTIQTNAHLATGLPVGQPIYVRLGVKPSGGWRYVDSVVRLGGAIALPAIIYPAARQNVDAATPFQWTHDPLAIAYRLTIGRTDGGSDLHDSSDIHVPRRYVSGLPTDQQLHARVVAKYADGRTTSTGIQFKSTSSVVTPDALLRGAKWATAHIRSMANTDNISFGNTPLAEMQKTEGKLAANCVTYALTLVKTLFEIGLRAPSRTRSVCLIPTYDCHAITELFDAESQRWIILDPTFGFSVHNSNDSSYATLQEISARARALEWPKLSYEYLTSAGDKIARAYYMDYPTLFQNVYTVDGRGLEQDPPPTIMPLYEPVSGADGQAFGTYALRCSPGENTARAMVDGSRLEMPCASSDKLTGSFGARIIQPITGETITIFKLRRFTF